MFQFGSHTNYNDQLCSLLLKDLCSIFANRFSPSSKLPQMDFESISTTTSTQIRKLLEQHYFQSSSSPLHNDLLRILTIYSYFDYFIVHRDDYSYLQTFRDEVLFKFLLDTKSHHIHSQYSSIQYDIDSLIKSCDDLLHSLCICDIAASKEISLNRVKEILNSNAAFSLTKEEIKIYKDVYNQLSTLLISMDNKTLTPQVYDDKILMLVNTFKSILKENDARNAKLFKVTEDVIALLNKSNKSVLVSANRDNMHLIICDHIYYRFGSAQMLKYIISDLNKCKNNNDVLIKIINSCENAEHFINVIPEMNLPYLIRYHMFDILLNLNEIENKKDVSKNEIVLLLNNLSKQEVQFKYFNIYFFDFIDDSNLTKKILINYSSICAKKICRAYCNRNDIQRVVHEIEELKRDLRAYDDSEKSICTVNEIAYWKYLDHKEYIEAIKVYYEIYTFKIKNEVSDMILNDNHCELDILMFVMFNNEHEASFYEKLQSEIKQYETVPKIHFILQYSDFILSSPDNIEPIKQFFNYCFPKKQCPFPLWFTILHAFTQKSITASHIDSSDLIAAFNHIITYEHIITSQHMQYASLYNASGDHISSTFSEIKDFLYKLKQA